MRPVIDLYATMHAESRRRNRAVIESLAAAVEAKDTVTSRHLRAVSRLATQLAREVEPAYCDDDDFLFGCLLHDVGKIGVPEKILMKPGALTDDEWEVMRRHPQTGARVVRPLGLAPWSPTSSSTTTSAGTAAAIPTASPATRSRSRRGSSASATRSRR